MKFLILSAGQSGRLVAEVTSRIHDLECTGFLDNNSKLHGTSFYGVRVLGGDELLETYAGTEIEGALPVVGNLQRRIDLFKRCKDMGFRLPNVIEPSVVTASDVVLGEGIFISFGAAILNSVFIDDYALIGTGVNILHDTVIGKNCVIGGGTTIGASVTVGNNVFFGVGVTVASGEKRIGSNVKIGAGSVILSDIPDNAFVLGNPARVIRRFSLEE